MATRARSIGKSVHSSGQAVLCELLIEARDRAGLTQQQLAKRLGKHQSFVAKYEGGERRVDVLEFLTIARAIGADPARLLKALMRRVAQSPFMAFARSEDDQDRAERAIRLLSFRSTSRALRACVVANKRGCGMDANVVEITIKAYLAEMRQRLDEAASIAKAAQACADAGNIEKG